MRGTLFKSQRVQSLQFVISAAIMLITILSILIVGVTLYNRFSQTAEQNAAIHTRQIVDQVNVNLDYYLRSMMEISDSLKDIIYAHEDIDGSKLREQMDVILHTRKDIVTLAVFSDKGELVTGVPLNRLKSWVDVTEQDWFKAPLEEPSAPFFSSPHVQNLFESQHSWVVSLSREITFNRDGQKVQGVLLVDMNFSAIDQVCQRAKLGKKGYIYILDAKGNIVYHPQQQLINNGLKTENTEDVLAHIFGRYFDNVNGEKRLITIETVNYSRWRLVGIAYMNEIVTTRQEMGSFVWWTLALGSIFVVVVSSIISSFISKPIKKLEKSMKMVEKGVFDIAVEVPGENEVAHLARAFNLMVARIRQLMEQIVVEQEAKRKSEFEVLQAQINPHFLYNTLNSVVRLVGSGKNEEVVTMITSLSRLFRISISKGRNIITLQDELEHARNYLIIQKIRYKSKFRFEIEAQDEVLQYKCIKLLLQPIIENAIYHGIEYMVDEGVIRITASLVGDRILLQVQDNGVGMPAEIVSAILTSGASNGGSGVGVKNVHERIQLCYGKQYGLEVQSEPEEGTMVKIWIPAIKDERGEEARYAQIS